MEIKYQIVYVHSQNPRLHNHVVELLQLVPVDLRMEVLSLQHLVQISVVQEQQVPFQGLDLGLGSV